MPFWAYLTYHFLPIFTPNHICSALKERTGSPCFLNLHVSQLFFCNRVLRLLWKITKPEKTDILYDFPEIEPSPPCDDDRESFEIHIKAPGNKDRLRILLYGYRLITMFEDMDTPYNTTSSMSRQILRRVIKEPSGKIDQDAYDYYWKCLYHKR